jgi:crotonobetainyl-CoA:carnitine CoA-transferase CaiB-like acyl-CoA transferase
VPGPLAGIRILDLSIALTGPYAAVLLGDQGAEVIKVERPGIGDLARWVGVAVNGVSAPSGVEMSTAMQRFPRLHAW